MSWMDKEHDGIRGGGERAVRASGDGVDRLS